MICIHSYGRVSETMPLYDILNEFQKGHSHMAVVIRQHDDTEQSAGKSTNHGKQQGCASLVSKTILFMETNTCPKIQNNLVRDVRVDIDGDIVAHKQSLKSNRSLKKLKSLSSDTNLHRCYSKHKKWANGVHSEVLHIDDDHLPSLSEEGKAIGIITLEDVIEELLQVREFSHLCFSFFKDMFITTKISCPLILHTGGDLRRDRLS